jgi:hypothetical protein
MSLIRNVTAEEAVINNTTGRPAQWGEIAHTWKHIPKEWNYENGSRAVSITQ